MELQIIKKDSDYGDKFIFHPEGDETMFSERRPRSQELSTRGQKVFTKKKIFSDIGDKIHIYPHHRPLRFDETWSADLMSMGFR